jgi:hypothetical protein
MRSSRTEAFSGAVPGHAHGSQSGGYIGRALDDEHKDEAAYAAVIVHFGPVRPFADPRGSLAV